MIYLRLGAQCQFLVLRFSLLFSHFSCTTLVHADLLRLVQVFYHGQDEDDEALMVRAKVVLAASANNMFISTAIITGLNVFGHAQSRFREQ